MPAFNMKKLLWILFVLGVAAYANVIFHPFVHDEIVFIRQNADIANLADWPQVFFTPVGGSPDDPALVVSYYRPLLEILSRVQYRFFHFNPAGYHAFNVVLHFLNSFLLFILLTCFLKKEIVVLGITALFMLHPVQTEAVACISGVSNLALMFFGLLSFLSYVKGRRFFSFLFFVVALLFKEQAIVLPGLFLLYELCLVPSKGKSGSGKYLSIIGLGLGAGIYLLWRRILLAKAIAPVWSNQGELALRLLAAPRTILMYVRMIFSPYDLHYYRSVDILEFSGVSVVLFVLLAGVCVLWLRRIGVEERKVAIFGLGWFFIMLFPAFNIIPLVTEYSHIVAFEHFLYIPLAGFFVFVFVLLEDFRKRWPVKQSHINICMLLLVVLCAGLTVKQNTYWRSEVALFERVLKYEKKLGRARILLARAYLNQKKYEKAAEQLLEALVIMKEYHKKVVSPEVQKIYGNFIKEIYVDLGRCYDGKEMWPEAIVQYKESLRLGEEGAVYNAIGMDCIQMNNPDAALENFEKAISLNSQNPHIMNNLAICYIQKGEKKAAIDLLREVVRVDASFLPAKQNLKKLLSQ